MHEEWREVYGYDVLYEVSNTGKVRTKHHGKCGYKSEYRFIKPVNNGNGYMRFNFMQGGKQKTVYLHRLVAEYFVENTNGYTEVNHIDEDKTNNDASNLEWCTHLYNCNYGTRNERAAAKTGKKIICVETGQIYESTAKAAKALGVGSTAISNCLNGRTATSCGYTWKYA